MKPLDKQQVDLLMPEVSNWVVSNDLNKISREWGFKDFVEAIIFINEVAHLAEEEGHHPDMKLHSYNKVIIDLSTHAIKGLSENDFIVAAKIDQIDIRHLL